MINETLWTYWFVRVKEVGSEITYGEQVDDHQFKVIGGRDVAKDYCIKKYGNLAFKKPKNAPDGTKYFYLMESNRYWYDKNYTEYNLICEHCGKAYVQVGDTYKSKRYNYYKHNLCSLECRIEFEKDVEIKRNSMDNENYWVSDSQHPLTDKNKLLVGYIYRITNKRLMTSYVGKTIKPPLFRWWQHLELDGKFEQSDLTELLFEVIEIVYFDKDELLDCKYTNGDDKLSQRERYYIEYYDTLNNGFNKI